MGTAWILASSTATTDELALQGIVSATVVIAVIIVVYVATRARLNTRVLSYGTIIFFVIVTTMLLLSETIQTLTATGGGVG